MICLLIQQLKIENIIDGFDFSCRFFFSSYNNVLELKPTTSYLYYSNFSSLNRF